MKWSLCSVNEVNEARFSPVSDEIIVSGNDNITTVYSIPDQSISEKFDGIKNLSTLSGLNYDPSSYWDHYIANWIRQKNKTMLGPNAKHLVRGKFGQKIKRWDLVSGRISREYSQNEKAVLAFDISPDGKQLVSGDGAGRVLVYDFEKGDTLYQLGKLRELVFDVRYSHNQKNNRQV